MQETRVADGDTLRAAEQTARISKWNLTLAPCRVTECGGKSAGVAVATKSHIGMAVTEPGKLSQGLHQQGRFAIRRVGAICRGGLHLGSTYLTSGVWGGGQMQPRSPADDGAYAEWSCWAMVRWGEIGTAPPSS